jgi:transcriptional regulator with XRE-family HTH domain
MGRYMTSSVSRILPTPVRRGLKKLARDIAHARRRRRMTEVMMAERLGVARSTYQRLEDGDPGMGIGVYAMALFVLGLNAPFADLADPAKDEHGLLIEAERLPKRIRARRSPGTQ